MEEGFAYHMLSGYFKIWLAFLDLGLRILFCFLAAQLCIWGFWIAYYFKSCVHGVVSSFACWHLLFGGCAVEPWHLMVADFSQTMEPFV
ncbi:hypothetical protein LSM04_006332 [Trypanosoma melophagium]|uniref:uncharacterized protein n=1 Tax=Trypanosoma melophagium TaxID=715481 RepID=UPI00351A4077|nr:hypothetical protein LSM04_006332 [Trypanosoma melophagium]